MPKILTPEQRKAKYDALDAKKAEKVKAKPVKEKPIAKAKAETVKVNNIDEAKQELRAEMDRFTKEMRDLLKNNLINGNGTNGHASNGHAKEPAPAQEPKTQYTGSKEDFYKDLDSTDKSFVHEAKPLNDPAPPQQAPKEQYQEPKQENRSAPGGEEPEPEINWSDEDMNDILNMIPALESAVGNMIFFAINLIDPTFNRKIDVEDIPPMDDFRKKLLMPGIKVFANKIVEAWSDPGYIYMLLAAFTIMDMFMYSKPGDPIPNND